MDLPMKQMEIATIYVLVWSNARFCLRIYDKLFSKETFQIWSWILRQGYQHIKMGPKKGKGKGKKQDDDWGDEDANLEAKMKECHGSK